MTQDLFYYETGYIDNSYFVYTADAASAITSSSSVSVTVTVVKSSAVAVSSAFTQSAQVNAIRDAASALSSAFTQVSTISHIHGADLFALSNAALSAEVNRIRDNNIAASSAFTVATDANRTRNYSSSEDAAFALTADNLRVRYDEAALTAAFSLTIDIGNTKTGQAALSGQATLSSQVDYLRNADAVLSSSASVACDATRIPGGVTVEASGAWTSTASLTATISHIEGADLSAFTNASLSITALRIKSSSAALTATSDIECKARVKKEFASALLESAFTEVTAFDRLRDNAIDATVTATVNAAIGKIVQLESIEYAAFTPSITCSITVNSFAVLDATSALSAQGTVTRSLISNQSSAFTQSVSANRLRSSAVALSTSASMSTDAIKLKLAQATLSAAFTQSVDPVYTRFFSNLGWVSSKGGSGTFNSTYRFPSSSTGSSVQLAKETISSPAGEYLYTSGDTYSTYKLDFLNDSNWTVEFALGNLDLFNNGSIGGSHTLLQAFSSTNQVLLRVYLAQAGGGSPYIAMTVSDGSTSVTNTGTSPVYSSSATLKHIAVVRNGTTIRLYLGGNDYAGTISTTSFSQFPAITQLQLSTVSPTYTGGDLLIDEFRLSNTSRYSGSSFTVPTSKFVLDTSTVFLSHFDSSLAGYNGLQLGAAGLTSTAIITADVRKFGSIDASASLSTTATQIAQAIKTVNASVSLSANGFVTTVNGRIRPEVAGLDSAFSLSATATRVKPSDIALTSQFTQVTLGKKIRFAAGALSAQVSLSAQPTLKKGLQAGLTSTSSISCSVTLFSSQDYIPPSTTEALYHFDVLPIIDSKNATDYDLDPSGPRLYKRDTTGTRTYSPSTALVSGKFNNTYESNELGYSFGTTQITNISIVNTDFNVETWYKFGGDVNEYGYADGFIFHIYDVGHQSSTGSGAQLNYYNSLAHSGSNDWSLPGRTLYVNYNSTTVSSPPSNKISDQTVVQSGQWTHYLISRQGSTYRFFINGQLNLTWTETRTDTTGKTLIETGAGGQYGYYDEFRFQSGQAQTTNFTPATQPYRSVVIKPTYGFLTASSTVTAAVQRVKEVQASLTSNFTVTAQGNRVRFASPALTSSSTVTANAIKVSQGRAQLASTGTLTSPINRLRQGQLALSTTATTTAAAVKVIVSQAQLQVTASAVINNNRIRGLSSALSAQCALTSNAVKTSRAQASFSALATELNVVNKIGRGFVHLDATSQLTAQAQVTSGSVAHVNASASLTVQGYNIQYGTADLHAQASQTAVPTYLRRNESIMTARSTVQCAVNRIRTNTISQQSQATLTANNTRIRNLTSSLIARATVLSQNQILRLAQANLQATARMPYIVAGVLVRFEANLVAFDSQLTQVDVINIDPYYQIKISPESRFLIITEESRLLTIKSETRVNKIKGKIL